MPTPEQMVAAIRAVRKKAATSAESERVVREKTLAVEYERKEAERKREIENHPDYPTLMSVANDEQLRAMLEYYYAQCGPHERIKRKNIFGGEKVKIKQHPFPGLEISPNTNHLGKMEVSMYIDHYFKAVISLESDSLQIKVITSHNDYFHGETFYEHIFSSLPELIRFIAERTADGHPLT